MRPTFLVTDLNFPSDDFQALLIMLASNHFRVVHICCTDGNTWAEEVLANVQLVLEAFDYNQISLSIASSPRRFKQRNRAVYAKEQQYKNFIGCYEKSDKPRATTDQSIAWLPSFDEALDALAAPKIKPIILSLGPLFPIAQSMDAIKRSGAQLALMGGRLGHGRADFNFWFDPESANTVLNSSLPITLLPRNICDSAVPPNALIKTLYEQGLMARLFAQDVIGMRSQHGSTFPLVDSLLALITLDPLIVSESRQGTLNVQTAPAKNIGKMQFQESADGNVTLITAIDHCAAMSILGSALTQPSTTESDQQTFDRLTYQQEALRFTQRLIDRPLLVVDGQTETLNHTKPNSEKMIKLKNKVVALLTQRLATSLKFPCEYSNTFLNPDPGYKPLYWHGLNESIIQLLLLSDIVILFGNIDGTTDFIALQWADNRQNSLKTIASTVDDVSGAYALTIQKSQYRFRTAKAQTH